MICRWLRSTRAITCALAGFLLAAPALSQTCSIPGQAGTETALTAQPNSFYPGTNSPAANATSITVGPGTGVNRAIQAGDLLLIIQMQGAEIDTDNNNGYGDGTVNNGVTNTVAFGNNGYAGGNLATNYVAGNYEWAVAAGGGSTFGAGGTVFLSAPLTRGYFNRANTTTLGKQSWQVIRVPQYANATVTAGLTVQPWNGSSGGVLALEATGTLDLNGQTINGTGRGFRGGGAVERAAQCDAGGTYDGAGCQEYRATIAANRGGSKGEGIAGTPARIYTNDPTGGGGGTVVNGTVDGYPGGEAARGAPGNAGGGGNQHNAGGGGGGNGNAGGNGGNSWNGNNVNFVGLRLGGFGGAPAISSSTRWLMGGGGGAGDVGGNAVTSPDGSGGAGGALVVIRAGRIDGGGGTINVNGAPGRGSTTTDAGGGGGAGGTVILTAGANVIGGVTINALGGAGGAYGPTGNEQDGTGGGGGGGVVVDNIGNVTFGAGNRTGGAAGTTNSGACNPDSACGTTVGLNGAGAITYAGTTPGVLLGYECLPSLTITKATTTPLVTVPTGATANYVFTIRNSGGGARFVNVEDYLPPGWGLVAGTPPEYLPVQPLAAGRLSTGAETVAAATSSTWVVGAFPITLPSSPTATLTISSFALAPINQGVPSALTFNVVVSIPETATVGTYHNPAGVDFLDPTRAAGSLRVVSPQANVTANRLGLAYAPNTYANFAAAATTNVAGSNYSGLAGGPTDEDVRLIADFSVTKTAPATVTPLATFTYTITPRNNGRPIGAQVFANTQATSVTIANVPLTFGASLLTVTDTLPTGVTLTAPFSGTGWVCTGTGAAVCTRSNANAYPMAASTDYPVITATAMLTATCTVSSTPRTNTATISTAAGETVDTNNTDTAVVTPNCINANLTVTKTNGTTTVLAGSTVFYTLTVANTGPGNAPGTVLQDPAATGLTCSAVACSVGSGTAVCPAGPTVASLQGAGLTIPTLNANSSLNFLLTCAVTASGS
jgi:uncharacterized repeat protein (TIGR01451 family)